MYYNYLHKIASNLFSLYNKPVLCQHLSDYVLTVMLRRFHEKQVLSFLSSVLLCLLRFLCLLTSWTCMVIRVCPSRVCPSATPVLPTCPTSKGNTQVSRTVCHCRGQTQVITRLFICMDVWGWMLGRRNKKHPFNELHVFFFRQFS